MPDDNRDQAGRPSPDALLEKARAETRGRLKIFLGAAPVSARPMRCSSPAAPRSPTVSTSSSASSKPTAARRPRRSSPASRSSPRRNQLQGPAARGNGPRRHPRPQAGSRAGRRTRPHQCRGQPPSEALSRRQGIARSRHRRLYDAEHPARRKPERRRFTDHPHPCARDGAGLDHRPCRRRRDHRSDAG